jgi:carboxymethylenebutenolidase
MLERLTHGRDRVIISPMGADLGAVFDDHVRAEFVDRDLGATMETMVDDPYVNHVPVMTGGVGRDEVARFYGDHFIGHWPEDVEVIPVSRTSGTNQVVDELVLRFTHDIEMPALLPGVAPTGRRVELAFAVVVGFRDGKITHEHIYWDQASLLTQVGLLDPETLPVTGAEHARKVLDPSLPANALIERAQARKKDEPSAFDRQR